MRIIEVFNLKKSNVGIALCSPGVFILFQIEPSLDFEGYSTKYIVVPIHPFMAEEKNPIQQSEDTFVNPIDADKITETPSILPYAHHRGSIMIEPVDRGKVKGRAMAAMYEQTDLHLDQIRQQIELLARQAQAIQDRVAISEKIYMAEMGFEPIIGKNYYLYLRNNGKYVLSLVSPQEWGKQSPYEFVAAVKLLADHTWEVMDNKEAGK